MKVEFYGHVRQYPKIQKEIDANMQEVLLSGNYVQGPMLKRFEGELAAYHGMKHAVGLANGTDAIWLALMALGIGPGDEVITHPNTFFATAEAIWIAGATTVFVDCDPKTKCIDPAKIEAAITPKTKAIIPVHLYGQCADMVAIKKIADKHNLRLVEDNAQGIGAAGPGFKVGHLSDAVTTSFIIQKNLGTFGDGGALVTNNADMDAKIRKLRNHGSTARNVHSYGFNSRLDDLHAGVLSAKLKHIDAWNDLRRQWAVRYTAGLKGAKTFDLPVELPGYRHVFHLYVIETKKAEHRDQLVDFLVKNNVDAKTHYSIAIHKQDGYPWGKGARITGSVANAEANALRCISLPMFPELTAEEVDYVIAKVKESGTPPTLDPMNKYRVLVAGMGKRGMHHATAFNANPRFQVAGICDIDASRLDAAAAKLGNPATGTDAAALAKSVKPDVFCFCTLPNLRTPLVKAAIECGAKLIAFEKPVALTSAELFQLRELISKAGVKAVVSHQHRYGVHYRKTKELIASGALGRVHTVYGSATGWMTHMLSHLIDYTCWFNDYTPANWAMAQAAGTAKLADNHPSPDYIGGFVQFANGVRGIYECGAGAPDQPEVGKWWGKNRIGAQGTEGFAEVLTNGGWRAVTKSGGYQQGEGVMNYDLDMPPYIQEMADWLDDDKRPHQCNFEHATLGAEIMLAMQRSAAEGGQVPLPLPTGADEQALLKSKLSNRPVLVSSEQNRKEFGLA